MKVAVLGATGGQGGAVVTALLQAGRSVRAVVRDPAGTRARALASAGAEVVRGSLLDADSLADAFRGTDAAYAVTTPFEDGLEAEKAQGVAIVDAAAKAALPHLVMASVASADRETGIPHFETKAHTEKILAASGLPATVVAPTYFYDNVFAEIQEVADGEMTMALPPDTPLQQVARRDLGRVVAAVIADPGRWTGRRIEVAGDDPTPTQMTRAVGQTAGGTVTYRQIPLEDLLRAGPDMGAMYAYLTLTGYQVDIPALHAAFPDIPWISFPDWAAEQHWPVPVG
ncbi:NmrA/HSCARG family protein [Streptomyces tsukubensis]|uniref:NmrA family transcriptional regulator n=1 Tax=Streptomyces tsukubensis TaxID=83656 RepID=A0A1V4A7U3_9ACTN|nr:NmrA/HSCARG family protein [Streptomyces tsukubensis]OON78009.1 NmrA family transcriptional regulator [Streptomyces tsukubensis]QFR97173.1 NAD(P)H-binding protein [Streptomyces tsukubensis]